VSPVFWGKAFASAAQVKLLLAAWLAELLKLEVTVHTILIAKCASEEKTNVMHWKRARIVF
jgi:hypothetical protein